MKKALIAGVALVLIATGTAPAEDTRKWIWRCALVHTPSEEQEAEAERCEAKAKALAEHIAAHPEDAGLAVRDFNWILRTIVRPAA
jgi:hypothetical protein